MPRFYRTLRFLLTVFVFLASSILISQVKTKVSHSHNGAREVLANQTAYAYNYTSPGNGNFIKFSLLNPSTQIVNGSVTGNNFYGASFSTTGELFAIDGATAGSSSLYKIDTSTGVPSLIGNAVINATHRISGLAYDSALVHMYAVSTDGSSSTLYIVNTSTGGLVFIGNIPGQPSVVGIAASRGGTLFGVESTVGKLIKINTLTAQPTVIGSLGVALVSYQGMSYDPESGQIYLSANTPAPQLRTIDTTTGASSLIGNISGTVSVTGLAIQFGSSSGPVNNGLCEGFTTSVFPPVGWSIINTGDEYWLWAALTANCLGYGSAEFDFYDAVAGTEESLVTNVITPGTVDSLAFWEAYATYTTEDDQLELLTSQDTGTTWNHLVTLHGGTNGELVTAPPTLDPYTPACSEWQRLTFRLPSGTNRVRFHTTSAYGNNLFMDSVCIIHNPIGINPLSGNVPNSYMLYQNYPNPFNPSTKINYSIPKASDISLKVYDALGRFVTELVSGFKSAGNYSAVFDGSGISSGIYYYVLKSGDFSESKKMVLIK